MEASIVFGLIVVAVFAGFQMCRPGKSVFDR
jgi:hypothetical protein